MTQGRANTPVDFWARVDRSGGPDACWPFTARITPDGYAMFSIYGQTRGAHIVAVHLSRGEQIITDLQGDHTCHDPQVCTLGNDCPHRRCCNPAHITMITQYENNLRSNSASILNTTKTHCPQGHPYDEANTCRSVGPTGRTQRHCRTCARIRSAQWRQARRAS